MTTLHKLIQQLINTRKDLTTTTITDIHTKETTGYHLDNKDTQAHRATIIMINTITYIPNDNNHWQEWHPADPNLYPQLKKLIQNLPSHPTPNPNDP